MQHARAILAAPAHPAALPEQADPQSVACRQGRSLYEVGRCHFQLESRIMVIRQAILSEQRILEELQRRASLNNPGDREALLQHPDAIEVPSAQIASGCVFVAERDGALVGFAAVVPRDDGGAELDALFVEPHEWKGGVGRALVEHCSRIARSRGASTLHVIGNPHAQGFYLACGFTLTGTADTRFGTGLSMERAL